jgi:voltage-gated potassium channel
MPITPTRAEKLKAALLRVIRFLSQPSTYTYLFVLLIATLVGGSLLMMLLENQEGGEPGFRSFDNAFTFMLQNVAGVGLGAKVPLTLQGRLAGILLVLGGTALRAVLIAAVVSWFINQLLVRGKGVKRVKGQNHVLICGWNPRVNQVIQVLQREAFGAGVPIVLLAPLPENPLPDESIKFVNGNPMHAEDLERAGVTQARAAIVLTDESDHDPHTDSTYDARAVFTVLAVKAANPNLHVVAQMRDPENRMHFERARTDEVVASAEMSEGLLARSALNVGIANAFATLLRLDTTQEMYIVDTPPSLQGKTFQAALVHQQIRDNTILIGVIESDKPLLCPPPQYRLHGNTRLVILGHVRPRLGQ